MNPIIHVSQESSLLDSPIAIVAGNLVPGEVYTISASMYNNFGVKWASCAEFKADEAGEIDLADAQPLSGTYSSPNANGLFWSMSPVTDAPTREQTPLGILKTDIVLSRGQQAEASVAVSRQLLSSGIEQLPVHEDGLIGTYFHHSSDKPRPAVIVLGGSEGGLRVSTAALLASHGYNTFALAYFGLEGLPTELLNIPLETVERAIDWLSAKRDGSNGKIGIVGTSKGGELALASASRFPAIQAVAAFVPSGIVYPGLGRTTGSSWQYKGNPLPFANGNVPNGVAAHTRRALQDGLPVSWRETYRCWAAGETEAEIPVEQINGPVLLLSGGDDQLWPADWLSERVIDRLHAHDHPFRSQHVCYPGAGHAIGVPGMPTTQSVTIPYGNGMKLNLGGTPDANSDAQYKAWDEMIRFFKTYLVGNTAVQPGRNK